jgi:hypothetical protein
MRSLSGLAAERVAATAVVSYEAQLGGAGSERTQLATV